jgi:hypothetical protein
MDREIKVYKTDYEINRINDIRIVKLYDKNEKLLIIVPIEMIVVNTFFRNFAADSDVYEQCSESDKEEIQMSASHVRFLMIVEELGGKIQKVVIDDLNDDRIFATVYFTDYKGNEHNVPAEASDALVLALLTPKCDLCVKESMTDIVKNARQHRIYWYDADNGELLTAMRAASHDELIALPSNDVKQLLEIAAAIEDFEFAARLKKAHEAQQKRIDDFTKMMDQYMHENPQKFLENMIKEFSEQNMQIEIEDPDDDDPDDNEN